MKKILLLSCVAFLFTQLSAQKTEQFTQQFRPKVLRDGSSLRMKNKLSIEYDFTDHKHLKMTLNFMAKKEPPTVVESITLRTDDSYSSFSMIQLSQKKKIIKKRQLVTNTSPRSSNAGEMSPTSQSSGGISTTTNPDGTISTTHSSGGISTTTNSDGTISTTHSSGGVSTTANPNGTISTTHSSGGISTTTNPDGTISTTHSSGGISTTTNPDGTISTTFSTPSSASSNVPPSKIYETIRVEVNFNVIKLTLTKDIIEEILASKSVALNLKLNNKELFIKFKRSQVRELQRKLKATF